MRLAKLVPLLAAFTLASCDGRSALEIGPAMSAGGGLAVGPALALSGGHVCIIGTERPSLLAAQGEVGERAASLLARQPLPAAEGPWLLVIDARDPASDHAVRLTSGGEWYYVAPDADGAVTGLPAYQRAAICAPALAAKLVAVRTGAKRAGRSFTLATG